MNGDLGMSARGSNPRGYGKGRRLKAAFLRRVAHPVGALGGRAASPGDQISGLPEENSPPKGGLRQASAQADAGELSGRIYSVAGKDTRTFPCCKSPSLASLWRGGHDVVLKEKEMWG